MGKEDGAKDDTNIWKDVFLSLLISWQLRFSFLILKDVWINLASLSE